MLFFRSRPGESASDRFIRQHRVDYVISRLWFSGAWVACLSIGALMLAHALFGVLAGLEVDSGVSPRIERWKEACVWITLGLVFAVVRLVCFRKPLPPESEAVHRNEPWRKSR